MATNNPLGLLGFASRKKSAVSERVEKTEVQEEALSSEAPLFSVLAGNPNEEEMLALTMALLLVQEQERQDQNSSAVSWQRVLNRGQKLGVRLRPGPGSWRRAQPM